MNRLSWGYSEPNLGLGVTLVLRLLIFSLNAKVHLYYVADSFDIEDFCGC